MAVLGDILIALLLALPVWVAGTVVFDGIHWVLHLMLASRWRILRALAWPHSVHHVWLDRQLRVRWEHQRGNIWCHIVPEYLSQLAFTVLLLLVLPLNVVAATVFLQTGLFLFILSEQGLDINHRPIEMLDAYRPGFMAYPSYHALHHVYPNAYYSAYTKLVDYVVGGGTYLRGKCVAVQGRETPFGRALCQQLEREGVGVLLALESPDAGALAPVDILVIADPAAPEIAFVEAFVHGTRERQLPPEVWAVHERPVHPTARHYYHDVRVTYRTIAVPELALRDPERARRATRAALFFIRRGLNYVPTTLAPTALRDFARFRRSQPKRPESAPQVRRRAELLNTA